MILLVIDAVFVIIWLVIVNKLDSHQQDKHTTRTTLRFYFAGLLSYPLIAFLTNISPFAGLPRIGYSFLVTGPVEEFSKFAVFLVLILSGKTIREPRDGILQAATVGLAYASVENLGYGSVYGIDTLIWRSLFTTPGHMVYAVIWGFYTVYVVYDRRYANGWKEWGIPIAAVFIVAMIHGMFNTLLYVSTGLAYMLDILSLAAAAAMYVVFVRHSPYRSLPVSDYRTNIGLLEHAVKQSPRSAILNLRLTQNYVRGGYYTRAVKSIGCAIRANKAPYLLYYKGVCLILDGSAPAGQDCIAMALPQLSRKARTTLTRKLREIVPQADQARMFTAVRVVEMMNDGISTSRYDAAKYFGT